VQNRSAQGNRVWLKLIELEAGVECAEHSDKQGIECKEQHSGKREQKRECEAHASRKPREFPREQRGDLFESERHTEEHESIRRTQQIR